MKMVLVYTISLFLLFLTSCNDRDVLERKDGVSLPAVEGLTMQRIDDKRVRLAWNIPSDIPNEMELPVNVFVEVKEIINVTKTLPVFTATLSNAPTEFVYEIPDISKTYHITIKLHGLTKVKDVNYSGNIYSLGQTAVVAGGQ